MNTNPNFVGFVT